MTENEKVRKVTSIICFIGTIYLGINFFFGNLNSFLTGCFITGCIFYLLYFLLKIANIIVDIRLYKAFKDGYEALIAFHKTRYETLICGDKTGLPYISSLVDCQGSQLLNVGTRLANSIAITKKKKQDVLNTMGKIHQLMTQDFVPYS